MVSSNRPNVLQVVFDDLGFADLGMVNGIARTPNVDALARDGAVLSRHYSASPVCAPARASLLSGRYPQRDGVIDTLELRGSDRLSLDVLTVADLLSARGYRCGLVGKWHTGSIGAEYHPLRRGFEHFVGFRGGWSDYWQWTIEKDGARLNADGRHLTDVFIDEARSFVEGQSSDNRPFFLHLALTAPHFPLQPRPGAVDDMLDRGAPNEAVARIWALIEQADEGLGALLSDLRHHGRDRNTLVIVLSDNGPDHGDSGYGPAWRPDTNLRGGKQEVWEGGIRVPAFVVWPNRIPAGHTVDQPTHFCDWLPTVIEAVDGSPIDDDGLDGVSMLPALEGPTPRPSISPRFWQWTRYTPRRAVNAAAADHRWKLVWPPRIEAFAVVPDDSVADEQAHDHAYRDSLLVHAPRRDQTVEPLKPMLFDLLDDPQETIDLSEERPEIVARLGQDYDRWFDDVESDRHRSSPDARST